MKNGNGFTLMEMLVILVILAILVIVVLPTYQIYILRGNRSDAIRSLAATQINEEKWRLNNTSYTPLITNVSPTGTTASLGGFYVLGVSSAATNAYTLTATATGSQASDTTCATYTLTYLSGTTTTNAPAECWQ